MTGVRAYRRTGVRCVPALGLAFGVLVAPLGAQQGPVAGAPAAYAIRNATIVPVVGPRIPGGTIVLRGGRRGA